MAVRKAYGRRKHPKRRMITPKTRIERLCSAQHVGAVRYLCNAMGSTLAFKLLLFIFDVSREPPTSRLKASRSE